MTDHEATLLKLIEDNWSIATGDLAKAKVKFSRVDWRTDDGLQGVPNVCVSHRSLRREQDVEEMFIFTGLVRVVWWSKTKNHADIVADHEKKAIMMDEVKKIIQNHSFCPSEWEWMRVDSADNQDIAPPIPPVLMEQITVTAAVLWRP